MKNNFSNNDLLNNNIIHKSNSKKFNFDKFKDKKGKIKLKDVLNRTGNTVRYNVKKRNWRRTKLGY